MASKLPLTTSRVAICAQCRRARSNPFKRRRFASSISSSRPEIYDVVTVGGGPAGLALLAALKSSPITSHLKTALIETQDLGRLRQWSSPDDQFSNRASSLTPSSVSFLEESGAWRHVSQGRVQAYDEMQVWDAANDATLQFDWAGDAQRYNAPPQTVATMTENANLTRGLLERIAELELEAAESESALFPSTNVSSITMGEDAVDADGNGLNLSTWPVLSLESRTGSGSGASEVSTRSAATTTSTTTIAARLVVGADGFNSPVRRFAGIDSHGWDYNRHGVVATVTVQPVPDSHHRGGEDDGALFDLFSDEPLPNRATAYQRFLPQFGGPIAILPLPNNRASLVWSTTPRNATYLKSLPPLGQVSMINAALRLSQTDLNYLFALPASASASSPLTETQHDSELRWRLQHTPAPPVARQPPIVTAVQEGSLASFPLRFRHATSLVSPRVALIGDAAHTVHPLAGQGLNLGLADAKSLASTIAYAVTHGMDLGDPLLLERYASDRFGKGLLLAGGVDALNSLYQLGSGGGDGFVARFLGHARGLGMKVVNQNLIPGLKGLIMKQAS